MKGRWKQALPFCFLLVAAITLRVQASGMTQVVGSNFNVYVSNGNEIGFQSLSPTYNFTFLMSVTSGTWNGSTGILAIDDSGGSLRFHAEDTATLRLYAVDADELSVGAQGGALTKTDTNDYSLSIASGSSILITWVHPLPSYLNYTMFAVGMVGVGLLVGSPTWVVLKIRKDGLLEGDSIERIGMAMVIMLIGLGLVFVWLWP